MGVRGLQGCAGGRGKVSLVAQELLGTASLPPLGSLGFPLGMFARLCASALFFPHSISLHCLLVISTHLIISMGACPRLP